MSFQKKKIQVCVWTGGRVEKQKKVTQKKVIAPTICPTEEKNETKGNIPENEGKKKRRTNSFGFIPLF